MAEVAGTLVSALLRRIRDPQAIANTRSFARSILSDSQRLINAGRNRVLETTTLTTNPLRMFYPLTASLPNAIRIRGVREGGRDLDKMTLKQLSQLSSRWFRHTSDRFEAFSQVGRDLLVVYPAKSISSSVDVIYTKLTNNLVNDDEATDLPDEDLPDVMDLAGAILLIKGRELASVAPLIERITKRLKDRLSVV